MTIYKLHITQQEAGMIIGTLAQLPYAQSAGLIEKLRAQVREQDEANAIPAANLGAPPVEAKPAKRARR